MVCNSKQELRIEALGTTNRSIASPKSIEWLTGQKLHDAWLAPGPLEDLRHGARCAFRRNPHIRSALSLLNATICTRPPLRRRHDLHQHRDFTKNKTVSDLAWDIFYGLVVASFPGWGQQLMICLLPTNWLSFTIVGWRQEVFYWMMVTRRLTYLLPKQFGSNIEVRRIGLTPASRLSVVSLHV
jgi:hypothetical protein